MAKFHEIRFPIEIAFGATGGPIRKTEIVTMASGHEARNSRWSHSKRNFNAGTGIKTLDQLQAVVAFFEERRGALYGFRFRDPLDWKSSSASEEISPEDQIIGIGDGEQSNYQLIKSYGVAPDAYQRLITKPVGSSVQIALNGVPLNSADFEVDETNGNVNFATPPQAGALVSAGYHFDVPVRFETDSLSVNLAKFAAGDIPTVPLVEIRL